jgi:hypothetical protein
VFNAVKDVKKGKWPMDKEERGRELEPALAPRMKSGGVIMGKEIQSLPVEHEHRQDVNRRW